jgi:ribosomal protein S18 acetylase RimI-like enzyme
VTAVTEVALGPEHLAGCVALSVAAGWNQSAADWRLMLEIGTAWGFTMDGELAASTLVIPYGAFAWISMVLVLPAHRRRGLATRLLRTALADLERRNLTPVLDATPAGREVYRQHGFRDAWGFKRFVVQGSSWPPPSTVRALREADWPWILELDRAAFGGRREVVLRSLAGRLPAGALVVEGEGFILGRDGWEAPQVGPLIAKSTETARTLLQAALSRASGPRYLDIADHAALVVPGVAEQRAFTRMVHGLAAAPGNERLVYCVAGPELG